MSKKKIAILSLSGGMDSTCLLVHLLKEKYKSIICISFEYGQTHRIEVKKASANIRYLKKKKFNIQHIIWNLAPIFSTFSSSLIKRKNIAIPEGHYQENNMQSTVVPNRNAIFSAIIYGYALSVAKEHKCHVDISLGIHAGDHFVYPDCTPQFRDALSHAFDIGNINSEKINYYTPYIDLYKTNILQDCLENCARLKLDFNTILKNTITSYNPDSKGRSSGRSGADIERIEAFLNIGKKDPITYQERWEEIVKHTKKVIQNYKSKYEKQ